MDNQPYDIDFSNAQYQDRGCPDDQSPVKFPCCQTCPLPKCKYDMTKGELAILNVSYRDRPVLDWLREHGSLDSISDEVAKEAADYFGVWPRTIYRIAKRYRDGQTLEPGS